MVLSRKKDLKFSKRYQKVYIHPDQCYEQRLLESNMKVLVNAMRSGNVRNIQVKGPRVTEIQQEHQNGRADLNHHHDRHTEGTLDWYNSGERENRRSYDRLADLNRDCYNGGERENRRSYDRQRHRR